MFSWLTIEVLTFLGQGLVLTIILTLLSSLFSVGIGITVGLLGLWHRPWATILATVFTESFRNIPALVLIIFFAFALPNIVALDMRQAIFFNNPFINWLADISGLSLPWYAIAATLGLSLNTAAYIAELFRAGVGTIAQEHVDAAQSMGASWRTIFGAILIPGGLGAALPAINSRLIHNFKNTALAAFVSVPEFFNSISTMISRSFLAIEFLVLAAIVYLTLSAFFSWALTKLGQGLYPQPASKGRAG